MCLNKKLNFCPICYSCRSAVQHAGWQTPVWPLKKMSSLAVLNSVHFGSNKNGCCSDTDVPGAWNSPLISWFFSGIFVSPFLWLTIISDFHLYIIFIYHCFSNIQGISVTIVFFFFTKRGVPKFFPMCVYIYVCFLK